jgi:hypothetical protein
MKALMPSRTLWQGMADFPARRFFGAVSLVAASTVLAWRIKAINTPSMPELGPRAQQLLLVRGLGERLLRYSVEYGRPVFMLTGVRHVSPAESLAYEKLRYELADGRIRYRYSDRGFTISWADTRGNRYGESKMSMTHDWPASAHLYAETRWMVFAPPPVYR